MADTLLVKVGAGSYNDLQSSKRIIQLWDDPLDTPQVRGTNITIPYAAGEVWVRKYVAARDYTIGMLVTGTSLSDFYAQMATLYGLLPDQTSSDNTCTLKLQRSGQSDVTASAEYAGGISPQLIVGAFAARLSLRFRLLTGKFA